MDTINTSFEKLKIRWLDHKDLLSKEDMKIIRKCCSRNFLNQAYFHRNLLIKSGQLLPGYVFRSWSGNGSNKNYHPFWVLFSPSSKVFENPSILRDIAHTINNLGDFGGAVLNKKFIKLLNEPLSDASYFLVPEELTNGKLVYVSIVYLPPMVGEKLVFGYNPFIINKEISNEIIFLPDIFWDEEFKDAYYSHSLM